MKRMVCLLITLVMPLTFPVWGEPANTSEQTDPSGTQNVGTREPEWDCFVDLMYAG